MWTGLTVIVGPVHQEELDISSGYFLVLLPRNPSGNYLPVDRTRISSSPLSATNVTFAAFVRADGVLGLGHLYHLPLGFNDYRV
jgi:hypothetical protein